MRTRDFRSDDACLQRRGKIAKASRWSGAMLALVAIAPAAAQETSTYTYDARGRLVVVDRGTTGPNAGHLATYRYDNADNRENVTGASGSGTTCSGVTFTLSSTGAVTEGANAVFTITKTGTATTMCSLSYGTANGTATQPGDYITTSGTVSVLPSQTSVTLSVPTTDDALYENTETFTMSLSAPDRGGHLGSPITATATINDNDAPQLSINNAAETEGDDLVFTVTRSVSSNGTVTVQYATASGTATAGSDYTTTSGTLTFASGETTKTITVTTVDDAAIESGEAMYVNLSSPTGGATIATAQGAGTIIDNDSDQCPLAAQGGTSTTSLTDGTTDPSTTSSGDSAQSTATPTTSQLQPVCP